MKEVKFRTNIQLKSIIGKDLITDDNIAVIELVKNSFDAGSKESKIIFRNTIHGQNKIDYKSNNDSEIIISDKGSGMSESDIENKWLNIAYSEKKSKKERHNRLLAGNKGVGRFSCDRLGKELTIYTKKGDNALIKLYIDWREFENIDDINRNIQDIELKTEEISPSQFKKETKLNGFKSGTVLYVKNLREEWTHKKILSLKRQLEKFINPNQNFESEKFDVVIEAKEFLSYEKDFPKYDRINDSIKNQIFDKLNFKASYIKSTISKNGKIITTTLTDRGNEIFTLKESNRFNLLKDIDIHIYYLNPYSKAYFKRQTGARSVDFGSIFLFINGFRVPPYGGAGNDWLGMEQRKGQGYGRHLGTREVIGRIEINNVNFNENEDNFFIISNRSGVDNNKHYKQLTKNKTPFGHFFRTFRRLERFVVEGIKWDSIGDNINEREIEKKVLNDKNWNESKEEFKEDSLIRNKRVLSIVEKIIDVKKGELIELKINNDLVADLADEQAIKTKKELKTISDQLKRKNLTTGEIENLIDQISDSENELASFPSSRKEIERLRKQQDKLTQKLNKQYKARKALEEENARKEAEATRLEEELKLEKEKNTYLRTSSRDLTEDAKGLVHNIKITSKKISDSVDNLYFKILNDNYNKKMLLKTLGAIKFQSEKAKKISNIITRSNFRTDRNSQIADVVLYIEQYIDIYSDIYPKNELEFILENKEASLNKKFSLLDMAVVLDDLISNSEKASAKKIKIQLSNPSKKELKIKFSDDGMGVPKQFLLDEYSKEKIFELGITTTMDGSGIGLNSVRNGLKSMGGTIKFLGNGILLKGACFEIIIR